jgi:hypothetical protein
VLPSYPGIITATRSTARRFLQAGAVARRGALHMGAVAAMLLIPQPPVGRETSMPGRETWRSRRLTTVGSRAKPPWSRIQMGAFGSPSSMRNTSKAPAAIGWLGPARCGCL